MFDRLNIFINKEKEKEEKPKNFLIEIFSNKYELVILTFSMYSLGIGYQILKLIGGFNANLKIGNLMFFSFSNSLNDFFIIFGISFIFFLLTFIVSFFINLILSSINNNKNNKIIGYFILFIVFGLILFLNNFYGGDNFKISSIIWISVPYLLSLGLIATLSIHKKKLTKNIFYIFFHYLYYIDLY